MNQEFEIKKKRLPARKGGGKPRNRDARKNKRREEAIARQAEWDSLTPEQKYERVYNRAPNSEEAFRLKVAAFGIEAALA